MIKNIKTAILAILLPVALNAATLSGTVTIRNVGDPIVGAKVILLTGVTPVDSTTTDKRGVYSFTITTVGYRTLVVAMTGYQPATGNVFVQQVIGTYTSNISLNAITGGGGQTGVISGTVKNDSTKEALVNATVILSHSAGRLGPTPIDTVTTDGEGRFLFTAVPSINGYILEVSLVNFITGTTKNIIVPVSDTIKVPLTLKMTPKPTAAMVGTVLDLDTKASAGISMVILRKRVLVNAQYTWEAVDTVVTDTTGAFSFTGLQPSTSLNPYSLLASHLNYNPATSSNRVIANGETDSVNITLTKLTTGTMNIFVGLDSTGNKPLSGASVAALLQGPTPKIYTGITDAKGWVTFATVISGSYTVSANLTGFVSKEVIRSIAANEKDTGFIYLTRVTATNSKMLTGLVRDGSGKPIEGAKLVFVGVGVGGLTLSATSSATGDYSFSGIPLTTNSATVRVSKPGFSDWMGPVSLTVAGSFLNITLSTTVSLSKSVETLQGLRLSRQGQDYILEFVPSKVIGRLSIYNALGGLIQFQVIPVGSSRALISRFKDDAMAHYLVLQQGRSLQHVARSQAMVSSL